MAKSKKPDYSIVYCAPNLEAFQLSSENDPLTFEKELIYEGNFKKGDLAFSVDENTILHWKSVGEKMLSNGIEVPMPTAHTDDPEKKRANITGYRAGLNKLGKRALYGTVKFTDADAAKLAASADVSIFVPLEAQDGKGNTYKTPIRHVAFTNYPVIPGLEKFQAIAASFDMGDNTMPSALLPVAQQIGIQASDQMDDAQLANAIVLAFNDLKKQVATPKPPQPQPLPQQGAQPSQHPAMPRPFAAAFNNLLRENRNSKLNDLVKDGHITKASRDEIAAEFCTDAALALSLSADDGQPISNSFDKLVTALKHNKVVGYDERTGQQIPDALALAHDNVKKSEESELVKSAEKRFADASK